MTELKVTRVAVVACSRTKLNYPAPARELYAGRLFQASRAYAEETCDAWFIASGTHHLLRPEQRVEPYDYSLRQMQRAERLAWTSIVAGRLLAELPVAGPVVLVDLCGALYAPPVLLAAKHRRESTTIERPLAGLGIGERLSWLLENTPTTPASDLLAAALALGELADEIHRASTAIEDAATIERER